MCNIPTMELIIQPIVQIKQSNGVGSAIPSYEVSVQEAIKDVGLWRRIINGYPYKTIQELGVANKEEAFTATKQAIYCYIHENNPNDYEGIGEAGARTLQAMHNIIHNANNSTETKISSTIQIKEIEKEWKQDENERQYISKTFQVVANANMKEYAVEITKENAKITNLENKEKNRFFPNERFKVLIPIKDMRQAGSFNLIVESQIQTKPILYGIAPNSGWQDYALTATTYEDGNGEKSDEYPENETKIIIRKEEEETKEKLENTEFELLDENKNVVYADLTTDKEGKIEIKQLIPGKYYVRETKAKEGYQLYPDLIELQVSFQEEYQVTITNKKEENPKIKTKKLNSRKVLPVTGM